MEEEYCRHCDFWYNPEEEDHDDCRDELYNDRDDFANSSEAYRIDAELGTRFGN